MDPEEFAKRLSQWLCCRAGSLPVALAMDGKMIRDHIGLLTLAQHEDGAPQAVAVYDQKEGTERCEQTAAQGAEARRIANAKRPRQRNRRGRLAHRITHLHPQGLPMCFPLWDEAFSHAQ